MVLCGLDDCGSSEVFGGFGDGLDVFSAGFLVSKSLLTDESPGAPVFVAVSGLGGEGHRVFELPALWLREPGLVSEVKRTCFVVCLGDGRHPIG